MFVVEQGGADAGGTLLFMGRKLVGLFEGSEYPLAQVFGLRRRLECVFAEVF